MRKAEEKCQERIHIFPVSDCKELQRTPSSYPFGAADRLVEPICLDDYGYEEREYIIKGTSNVYEWPEGQRYPIIQTRNAPYGTRILIRRPIDPRKSSGIVVVEPLNWASKYDRSIPGWGHCFQYYLKNQITWIGVAVRETALDAMKAFDRERYQGLDFLNPLEPEKRGEASTSYPFAKYSKDNENGLIWDMLSQLAVTLKADVIQNPMRNYPVDIVYATGATAGDLSCYISAVHPLHGKEDDTPIYDGFLVYMTGTPGGINQVSDKMSELDERCKYYSEVPFIHVVTTGDMTGGGFHPDWFIQQRRPNANEPGKKFWCYEVAGAGVRAGYDKRRCVCREDVERIGYPWKESVDYEFEFPIRYILNAATEALLLWIKEGIEPPRTLPLETDQEPYPHTSLALDKYGNSKGGVRSPYVDVPLYHFRDEGGASRLPAQRIQELYQSKKEYLEKVILSSMECMKERFLLPEDAVEIILEAIKEELPEVKYE